MGSAREIVDIYIGSDEEEQFDMWFPNRELRGQFDAADRLGCVERPAPEEQKTRLKGRPRFLKKLAKYHSWPLHL